PELTAAVAFIERPGPLGHLEFLGATELGEPVDALVADRSALALVAEALHDSGRPALLKRVPTSSPLLDAVCTTYRNRGGLVVRRGQCGYPWIALPTSESDLEGRFNAGRRSDLRRARRMAERMGDVEVEVVVPSEEELEPLLGEAFKVEAASWKGSTGTA